MDGSKNPKKQVELFHLLFMEKLSQKLDKRLYVLKGGCNLRFFFGSIRYSEDIDLDVHTVSPDTLKKTVDKILLSLPFIQILKTHQMSIINFSTPKQTSTTQRWKVQLQTLTQSLPINTKIEFSRRNLIVETNTEVVSRNLLIQYKLRPFFISHYSPEIALEQKIHALILRTETQARDIFDIYHLIQTHEMKTIPSFTQDKLKIAINNALSINFAAFKAQVVSYLEPEYQVQYDDLEIWNNLVASVVEMIERCGL